MSDQDTSRKNHGKPEDIDKEVNHLLKKNTDNPKSRYTIGEELRYKYNESEIDAIMKKYTEKLSNVKKFSDKIRDKLISKYPNLSLKEYIEKITAYKKKYNFDDAEMNAIIHKLFYNKNILNNDEMVDSTYSGMSKALGFVPQSLNFGKMRVNKNEIEELNNILLIASATRELHQQVSIQSITYDFDTSDSFIANRVDKTKINVFSYVHPVVFALFIPKFQILENHMLLASISNIIATRHQGMEIQTQPDYELYMDIATDPSEVACVTKSQPFKDLLARCNVQTKLWESVLNLRQGKYYINDLSTFILAIDTCRNNIFDAADLAYVKDEGTVLRKLFGAFSFRPTIVSTSPIYGLSAIASNIASMSVTHITTISIITMRVPLLDNAESISLNDALSQRQAYIHKRQITVKKQEILYSKEILVFYVHRRFQAPNLSMYTTPYKMASLPVTLSEYEQLHNSIVVHEPTITLHSQIFNIRSIVVVDTVSDSNMIIGCSTYVYPTRSEFVGTPIIYRPLIINNGRLLGSQDDQYIYPLSFVDNIDECKRCIQTKGTLFVYQENASNVPNRNSLFKFN